MRERDDGHRTESGRGRVSAVPTFQLRCRDANPPRSTIPTGQPPLALSDRAIPLWRRRPPSTSGYPGGEGARLVPLYARTGRRNAPRDSTDCQPFVSRQLKRWLRGRDLNPRPLGYEPNELPDCSTPRQGQTKRPAPPNSRLRSVWSVIS